MFSLWYYLIKDLGRTEDHMVWLVHLTLTTCLCDTRTILDCAVLAEILCTEWLFIIPHLIIYCMIHMFWLVVLKSCYLVLNFVWIFFVSNSPLTASQQALRNGLSLEVDRLGELIGKLENKVLIIRPICDNKNVCVCCNTKTPSTKWHVSSGLNILRMIVTNASTLSLHNFTILTEY